MKIVLIVVYLILTTAGVVFMKLGSNPGSISVNNKDMIFSINYISGIGLICYIISFILFTRLVVLFDLSYIVPICTGIVQVGVLAASYFIIKEKISLWGVIGASLIIVGIMIMNIKPNILANNTESASKTVESGKNY